MNFKEEIFKIENVDEALALINTLKTFSIMRGKELTWKSIEEEAEEAVRRFKVSSLQEIINECKNNY